MANGSNYNLDNAQIGNVNIENTVHGNQIGFQQNTRIEIGNLIQEIQLLLNNVANQTLVPTEQTTIVHTAIQQNPNLKQRLLGALKAGGGEALRQVFDHPVVHIPVETVRGWLEG